MLQRYDVAFVSYGPTAKDGGYKTRIISEIAVLKRQNPHLRIGWIAFEGQPAIDAHSAKLAKLQDQMQAQQVAFAMHGIPNWAASGLLRVLFILGYLFADALRLQPVLFHVQSHSAAYFAYPIAWLLRIPMVLDVHGVVPAERRYGLEDSPITYKDHVLEWLDTFLVRQSAGVFFVSNQMARYYAAHVRSAVAVVPCCVDTQQFQPCAATRDQIRTQLHLDKRTWVVYSGSFFDKWQEPQDIVAFFHAFKHQQPDALLVILTNDAPHQVEEFISTRGLAHGDFVIRQLPHQEVPRWLAAADVALLVRKQSLVNHVASPTKLAEYLASGLPVVITQDIGDYSDLVSAARIGLLLGENGQPPADADSWAEQLVEPEMRRRSRLVAVHMLDWEIYAPLIQRVYDYAAHSH